MMRKDKNNGPRRMKKKLRVDIKVSLGILCIVFVCDV